MTITIDSSRCVRCGICANNCPVSYIVIQEEAVASFNENNAKFCMNCGQCEAVCPSNAIRITVAGIYSPILDLHVTDITNGQLKKFLLSRRSIRHYRREPVEKGIIEDILDTVRYSPSAGNLHPVHWIIISDPLRIAKIAELTFLSRANKVQENPAHWFATYIERVRQAFERGEDPVCRHAPHLAIAAVPEENPFGVADSIIALSWFELAAYSYGIGACWAGGVKQGADEFEALRELLGIPKGHTCGYVMMFGYPEFTFPQIPPRKTAKVEWIDRKVE